MALVKQCGCRAGDIAGLGGVVGDVSDYVFSTNLQTMVPYTAVNRLWQILKPVPLPRPTPPLPAPKTVDKMLSWGLEDLEDARVRDLENWANPLFSITGGGIRSDGYTKNTGNDDGISWKTLGFGAVIGLVALGLLKRI